MKPYFYAIAAIFLWATLAALGLQLTQVPPFLLVGAALTIGGLAGLPWLREWKIPFSTLLLGVCGLFGYHFFLFMALREAPPVEANLINYLWPLLLVILAPLFFKEFTLKLKHLLAAVLGFAGALLIVTGGRLSPSTESTTGYIFALMAAFIWAVYSLLSKKVPPFPTAAVGLFCWVSGVLSLGCHFIFESPYSLGTQDLIPLLIMGLGPMGMAFFLWDKALKTGDPRKIGSLSYLTPMLSTLFLISSGKGEFTWITGAAMALILMGAAIGALAT